MKKVIGMVGVLCLPIILMSGGLKTSLLQAKNEQKPLMVLVTSDPCRYCDKMKKETLNNPSVKKNLEGFLFTQVDKTDPSAKKILPLTTYTPTVYFVSPKFKIVNSVQGYLVSSDFNLWVDDTKAKLSMGSVKPVSQQSSYVQPHKNDIWMYDIASAMDYASQTGKQIMIFVGSRKSKWSRKMEQKTLKSNEVKKALSNFVWVKLNHGDPEAKAYGINPKHVPAVYFMKSDIEELAIAKGFFGTSDFLQWVNYAKSKI